MFKAILKEVCYFCQVAVIMSVACVALAAFAGGALIAMKYIFG